MPITIADVAEATGLDRATARRCLLTLHELGYADYDGKFFTLTPRVLRLGMGTLAALVLKGAEIGPERFFAIMTAPRTLAALKLTLSAAAMATAF
uniref:helix-turn-helix domain-containing protein n=1 Tax=Rodentibacter caecimuris TaxID=1796644 RepID=UPI00366FA858